MADIKKCTDGPDPFSPSAYDFTQIPDYDNDFVVDDDFAEFAKALSAPENASASQDDLTTPPTVFITALNDWRPINQRVRGRRKGSSKKRRPPRRGKDEAREGFVYTLLKWPLLGVVFGWIVLLGAGYMLTRLYIYLYENLVTWRGKREMLRQRLQSQTIYEDWVKAAKELDEHLGNERWKKTDEYAYYDSKTVRRVKEQMLTLRTRAEAEEKDQSSGNGRIKAIDELRGLVEACVKNNFVGFENPRLYSETYFGTKNLVQSYVDEVSASLTLLLNSRQLTQEDKRTLFKHIHTNFGRTALCLSGGATFAYYHFGIAKALLDASLLPSIITGTSGGALVAALLATRTDDELKKLLVPALAGRITACADPFSVWVRRWYKTGARFDSVDWAKRCAWFCHGSLTFAEAYERTGRMLNVTCVPSDPHSPTILANYLTAPDCVIWSAVLASAAVPGILNPVVLMKKTQDGTLAPYSFGHKWKDGSLRTDIPLKALNLHFNVNFSIVSQVNPHINLLFFSSRGNVGGPVTHRKGRGWRGGFLGSATEQYLKLDLNKWLKVLRHLELLPRPLGQDWSEIWLQQFSGTITIWPRSILSDFYHILADPTPRRLARMIHVGQQAAFPKLNFISNRMKIECVIEEGRRATRPAVGADENGRPSLKNILSEEDLRGLLREAKLHDGVVAPPPLSATPRPLSPTARSPGRQRSVGSGRSPASSRHSPVRPLKAGRAESPTLGRRLTGWFGSLSYSPRHSADGVRPSMSELSKNSTPSGQRRGSVMSEIGRQSRVFFDDPASGSDTTDAEGADREGGADGDELEEALDEAEEWDVDEDKARLGLDAERRREDDAVQRFLPEDDEGFGSDDGSEGDDEDEQKKKGTFVG
ncbi:Patatin-like phospholipase domain-containing protein [Cryomyces minteri]|uniref:Patatin-like phospholipase domain-containing protein n=1 Tax=Cryomyces minteri TaxID=331657 RepID=A0A4U0X390_9PEZI|nr:Patatin-like phospholipase domain-containing protein [Cryomyces minteri]